MIDGLVSCDECVWIDECPDAKPDGWCEDFCLNGRILNDKDKITRYGGRNNSGA